MPDTPQNQAEYRSPKSQKEGVGLPIARAAAIISLATACVSDVAIGHRHLPVCARLVDVILLRPDCRGSRRAPLPSAAFPNRRMRSRQSPRPPGTESSQTPQARLPADARTTIRPASQVANRVTNHPETLYLRDSAIQARPLPWAPLSSVACQPRSTERREL